GYRDGDGLEQVDGAGRRGREAAVELALFLERGDLAGELRLLVDDRLDVRQCRGEERPNVAAHSVATGGEPASLEREARHHQRERDQREDAGAGEPAPERL